MTWRERYCVNEHRRIAILRELYAARASGDPPLLGIGDDAAVLAPDCVVSTDAAVDGNHFRCEWVGEGATWEDIGWRSTVAALSDLAAMGATPRAVLSSLILPASLEDDALFELARGIADAAAEHGTSVVGGNLARGRELSITTTVVGGVDPRLAFRRSNAHPGDGIYLSGRVGAASLGLSALEMGAIRNERSAPFLKAFLRPRARIDLGIQLLGQARCAIDISDGLCADLGHLCAESGLAAWVDLSLVPTEPAHDSFAMILRRDPREAVLAGGEDYELILASPTPLLGCTRVGAFERGEPAVRVTDAGGLDWQGPRGFDHFR